MNFESVRLVTQMTPRKPYPTNVSDEEWAFAARKSREVADNVRRIVAIELLAACQGIEFRRPLVSSQALEAVHAQVRSEVPRYDEDRYLAPEMQAMEALICWRALKTDPGCALNFDPPSRRG